METKLAVKKDDLTAAQMIGQLRSVGVEISDTAKKDEVWKVYQENAQKIDDALTWAAAVNEAKEKCLIKHFGDYGQSRLCVKCKKTQAAIHSTCEKFAQAAAEASQKQKVRSAGKKKSMGKRTSNTLWGTRAGTAADRFVNALVDAGDKGMTMSEASKAAWNPQHYKFKETLARLVDEGLARHGADGRFFIVMPIEEQQKSATG